MKTFALLLPNEPDRYSGLDAERYAEIIKDYIAWVDQLTEDGVYVGGHRLTDAPGKTLVAREGGVEVFDSPFAETAEVLGGLMLIRAESLEAAVSIARTNPHLRHNRRIIIREVYDQDAENAELRG